MKIKKQKAYINNFDDIEIKREKWKYSEFFITINTNKRYPKEHKDGQKDLNFLGECVLNMIEQPKEYLRIDGTEKQIENMEVETDNLRVEIGPKSRQLHCHFNVLVKHKCNDVKINVPEINKYYQECLGVKSLNIHYKVAKSSNRYIADYINKTIPENEEPIDDDN